MENKEIKDTAVSQADDKKTAAFKKLVERGKAKRSPYRSRNR